MRLIGMPAVAGAVVLALSAPAAMVGADADPTATVSPNTVQPGQTVQLTLRNCENPGRAGLPRLARRGRDHGEIPHRHHGAQGRRRRNAGRHSHHRECRARNHGDHLPRLQLEPGQGRRDHRHHHALTDASAWSLKCWAAFPRRLWDFSCWPVGKELGHAKQGIRSSLCRTPKHNQMQSCALSSVHVVTWGEELSKQSCSNSSAL